MWHSKMMWVGSLAAVLCIGGLMSNLACDSNLPEDQPCPEVCVEVLNKTPREPFVISFNMRLRDVDGSIKSGVSSEDFSISENGVPLDLAETNQFLRSGEGLPMHVMLVLDYTNSMAAADAIGPMIDAATAFVEPSPFTRNDQLALIELRKTSDGVDGDRIRVSPLFDGGCDTREAISEGTLTLGLDTCALGTVWDAVALGLFKLEVETAVQNRVIIVITDGQDPEQADQALLCLEQDGTARCPDLPTEDNDTFSCPNGTEKSQAFASAEELIAYANEDHVNTTLIPVGFGNTLGKVATLENMADSTGGMFARADTLEELETALNDVARFLREKISGPKHVAVIVDYTVSASQSDIAGLIDTVRAFAQPVHFNATQRIGVVEFHDRTSLNRGYSVVQPLIAADCPGRGIARDNIPQEDRIESGQTRLWDAVGLAIDELTAQSSDSTALSADNEEPPRRALVFLTDGNDTTSDANMDEIRARAQLHQIALYPIDFGEVTDESTAFGAELFALAEDTGGKYFPAERAADLHVVFKRIAEELRGQWNLTYITQKNAGSVAVDVTFDWNGLRDEFSYGFDAGRISGQIHEGALEVTDCREEGDNVVCRLRATYVPRNITRFRFRLPEGSSFRQQGSGGLTPPSNSWDVCTRGDGRCIELTRGRGTRHDAAVGDRGCREEPQLPGEPLQYGTFGNLGAVTVPKSAVESHKLLNLTDTLALPILHDDSIYDQLAQPKTMRIEGARFLITNLAGGNPCTTECREAAEDRERNDQSCAQPPAPRHADLMRERGLRNGAEDAAADVSEPSDVSLIDDPATQSEPTNALRGRRDNQTLRNRPGRPRTLSGTRDRPQN